MTKEEILAKSRQENQYQDEYNRGIVTQATAYGAAGMTVIVIVLCAIRFFVKDETFYDLLAMYAGYWVVSSVYKYKFLKEKRELILGVLYIIIAIAWITLYILKG